MGAPGCQTTLAESVSCAGVGLHGGGWHSLTLAPAAANAGICFVRADLGGRVPARLDRVAEARLGTTLAEAGCRVATVEHVLAALWGMGIDNAELVLDGPEVPALDGSAAPFVQLIRRAGRVSLPQPARTLEVVRPVVVEDGARRMALLPARWFSARFEIEFEGPVVGRQVFEFDGEPDGFAQHIAPARTFGFRREVQAMREAGRALGGSLENAVVVGEEGVLNPGGLRWPDEFVRHKLLDLLGDLRLLGARLRARVEATRSGHALTHALLRKLMDQPDCWRWAPCGAGDGGAPA